MLVLSTDTLADIFSISNPASAHSRSQRREAAVRQLSDPEGRLQKVPFGQERRLSGPES